MPTANINIKADPLFFPPRVGYFYRRVDKIKNNLYHSGGIYKSAVSIDFMLFSRLLLPPTNIEARENRNGTLNLFAH
jgi:hypothetical protein